MDTQLSENLILPYAPLDATRKLPFSTEMEIAAVACAAEAKRKKKRRILGRAPERIVSIAKLYYPFWLVPWENEYVTIDAMKLFSFEMAYGTVPDTDSFLEKIDKNDKSYDLFVRLLQQSTETFKDFAALQKVSLEGPVEDKELQNAIFEYFRTEMPFKEQQSSETAFLKEKITKDAAILKVNEIIDFWKKNQSDIASLQRVISRLEDAAGTVSTEVSKNIENINHEYGDKISQLRPIVEENLRQLNSERDGKIKAIADITTVEIQARMKEKDDLQAKLESLAQEKSGFDERKELAKLRKDEARVKRWKFSIREREKSIAELKKKMRKLQTQMDQTYKEKEKTSKQINQAYQAQIDTETSKISSLEASRDAKIAEIQENINCMHTQVNLLERHIEKLLGSKNSFATRLKGITTPWKLEGTVSLFLPFYVVEYFSESKERFEFYAPAMATSSEGLLKAIKRRFLKFALEKRIGALLRQRSKALSKMFSSTFAKRLDVDRELWNHLHEKTEQNNLLVSPSGFKEMLTNGLDSLVAERWVKPEERKTVLQAFSK